MMLPPAVVAGVAQGVGSFLSGKKSAGEARVARRAVDARMQEAIRFMKKAAKSGGLTGFDFKKLRDDAIAAGFNPLTALSATGGQGYDLASPFAATADLMVRRAELLGSMSGAVIDNAGYFGRALGDGFGAFFAQRESERNFSLDSQRLALEAQYNLGGAARSGGGFGGSSGFGGMPVANGPFAPAPGIIPGAFQTGYSPFTQGVTAMIGDALGMRDPMASWWNGDLMTGPESAGLKGWGAAWDAIAGGVTRVPYSAWKLRKDVSKIVDWASTPGHVGSGVPSFPGGDSGARAYLSSVWKRATMSPSDWADPSVPFP